MMQLWHAPWQPWQRLMVLAPIAERYGTPQFMFSVVSEVENWQFSKFSPAFRILSLTFRCSATNKCVSIYFMSMVYFTELGKYFMQESLWELSQFLRDPSVVPHSVCIVCIWFPFCCTCSLVLFKLLTVYEFLYRVLITLAGRGLFERRKASVSLMQCVIWSCRFGILLIFYHDSSVLHLFAQATVFSFFVVASSFWYMHIMSTFADSCALHGEIAYFDRLPCLSWEAFSIIDWSLMFWHYSLGFSDCLYMVGLSRLSEGRTNIISLIMAGRRCLRIFLGLIFTHCW